MKISSKLSCAWFRTISKPVPATPQLRKQERWPSPTSSHNLLYLSSTTGCCNLRRLSSLYSPTVLFLLLSLGITWYTSVESTFPRPVQSCFSPFHGFNGHWQNSLCYRFHFRVYYTVSGIWNQLRKSLRQNFEFQLLLFTLCYACHFTIYI